ncbi:MAG: GNAT family N-acetyltransferase [Chloroflexota bacterium]
MTAVSHEGHATNAVFTVERANDPADLRPMLEQDAAYSAYALAQLDSRLFDANEWLISRGSDGRQALVVHSKSGLGNALFATGDARALDVALSLHPGARFSFGSLRPEHRAVAEKYYILTRPQMMTRMQITPDSYHAVAGPAMRLGPNELDDVNSLYSIEGGPAAYRESHLEEGVYYGVFVGGELASIAGTHVVSRAEGTAVVGNVFTNPRYRGKGHATIATSAVTAELLSYCSLVVLTVETRNDPAVAIYTKLGYKAICALHETPLIRKEPLGLVSLARRALAGWRGRHDGNEVVVR